ncbi:MAG: selenocysteine-specific translation elongation factor [Deltaproteobacteria bacterium]|nr:selenocysteine-specific translation elongation factor [Deltaproteobacteria bacterium]
MKHIILGTAGHVDHGKTSLIKALTNVDTDRLKEEKERGITIELGFAPLVLPDGQKIGIVDVPGHEKFVKNMVAGAGGIDLVALVIAADEGVMPQTREHFEICELLGIKRGLIALTKIDMVDEEWLALVQEDVRSFFEGTFLEESPIIPLSSVTGAGLPEFLQALGEIISTLDERTDSGLFRLPVAEFLQALGEIISTLDERTDSGLFRLPVDRVFTMKGFGTVVTGTLASGKIRVGDTVEIMPSGGQAKIRGIQVHNETAEEAQAGQRTAINLQGTDRATIERGFVLTRPSTFTSSDRLDIHMRYLASAGKKLKNRALVRFHTGTSETISRIILPDRDELEPGEETYAQVIPETPVVAMSGDRFVIRSYSPVTTVGGGEITDPLAKKRRKHSTPGEVEKLDQGTGEEKTEIILERAGLEGIPGLSLSIRTGLPPGEQEKILEKMLSEKKALLIDRDERRVVSSRAYGDFQDRVLSEIAAYHEKYPLKEGVSREELRTTLGGFIDPKLFNKAMKDLEDDKKIVVAKENVRIEGHAVNLKEDEAQLREEITGIYQNAGLTPPLTKELMEKFSGNRKAATDILNVMLSENVLVKLNEDMSFHREALDRLKEDYRALLIKDGKATPATFKELTGLSRKFIIPLMEYFDKTKLTIRVEDHRMLRERSQ